MAEAFETKTTEETGRLLHSTDPGGLSAEEARKRLEQYGPNRLQEPEQPGFFSCLLSQFMDPLIYVLAESFPCSWERSGTPVSLRRWRP